MKVYVPPYRSSASFVPFRLFLAGSIDMGHAEDWQSRVIEKLEPFEGEVYNPRRPAWNSTWRQDISNKPFNEQVTWEMDHLEFADAILFHFESLSKSPITLLELGLMATDTSKIIVVSCVPGFWRRGNVQMVCDRYGLPLRDNLDEALELIYEFLTPINAAQAVPTIEWANKDKVE